jgi:hypothetical protein
MAAGVQDGDAETSPAQLAVQLVPIPDEHAARAILSQMSEHEAATVMGEQPSPHAASGPASSSWLDIALPPQPTAAERATNAALSTMYGLRMVTVNSAHDSARRSTVHPADFETESRIQPHVTKGSCG